MGQYRPTKTFGLILLGLGPDNYTGVLHPLGLTNCHVIDDQLRP